jgi:hypothetical protein
MRLHVRSSDGNAYIFTPAFPVTLLTLPGVSPGDGGLDLETFTMPLRLWSVGDMALPNSFPDLACNMARDM